MATTTYTFRAASPAFLMNNVGATGDESGAAIASNAAGTCYFGAWTNPSAVPQGEGRLINRDGTPASGVISIDQAPVESLYASLAGLAGGGFVATYTDRQVDAAGNIKARLFDADGLPGSFLDVATGPVQTAGSDVAALTDGGFAVTWTRREANDLDILVSVHNADGSTRHAAGAVAVTPAHDDDDASIASLAGGGFVVAWGEFLPDSLDSQVRFRRFDANFNALDGTDAAGVVIDAAGGKNGGIEVAGLPDGGFVVAYTDDKWGNGTDITAVVFNPDGTQRSAFLHVNGTANGGSPAGDEHSVALTVLPNGDFVVGWSDRQSDEQYLQAYDALGNALGQNALVATDVQHGEIAALSGGLIADVWQSSDGDTVRSQVLELNRIITGDGSDETITGVGDDIREFIHGNGGNDTLKGGGGHDTIDGGIGNDTIWGGAGDDTAVFAHTLEHYTVYDFGSRIVVWGAEGFDQVSDVEHLQFADGTITVADDGNALFDTYYYLSRNPDVFHAGVNALDHFSSFGRHEGRDPNAFFDTSGYLALNEDVAAAGANSLEHYHHFGWHEGRDPSADFDTTLYLLRNPDVAAAGVDPLEHYLAFGASEGRQAYAAVGSIAGGFDAQYYLFHNPDVAAAGVDARAHFDIFGWQEGRKANAYFNTAGYLAQYADVAAAGVNPLEHYQAFGWKEGRDPSAGFDTLGYLAANPDVAAANVNPLEHYLQFGVYEGRQAINDGIWH